MIDGCYYLIIYPGMFTFDISLHLLLWQCIVYLFVVLSVK